MKEPERLDPSDRVWPIQVRCFFVGCFYPEGDRCAFCLQPRPARPLGYSPLAGLLQPHEQQVVEPYRSPLLGAVARSASSQADRSTRVRQKRQDRGHAFRRRG